jgi:hypothetical protein
MAKRADHAAFEDAEPNLRTCIAELRVMLREADVPRRIDVLEKTIACLERRADHLDRMD